MDPPLALEAFLEWLRVETEATWANYHDRAAATAHVVGVDWAPGTRWTGGLGEHEIDEAERRWSIRFPEDHRRFLRILGATDRPLVGRAYVDGIQTTRVERPGFYDFRRDHEAIADAIAAPLDGILFDIEQSGLWWSTWGDRPVTESERAETARRKIEAAPRLVPLVGHRYLVAGESGNPVLSVHQSDIIVYGADLRSFLLHELESLLPVKLSYADAVRDARSVPFWLDFG